MACVKCRGIADLPLEFFNPPLRYGRQAGLYSNARDTQYDDDPDAVIELSYESYVEGCSTPANPSPANPSPTYSPTSPTSPIYSPQADPSPTNPSPTYSPTYSPTSPAYSLTADPSPNFSPTSPLFEQDFTSKSPDPPAHEISYNHWPNATDLKKSTEDGCAGCALILESLLQHSSSYGEPPSVQDKVDNLQALLSGPPAPIILTSLNTAFNSIIDWYYRRHIDFEPNELIRHLKVACATAKEDGELEFFVKHEERNKIPQWFASINGREIFHRSDSERCFGLAKEWLQNCLEHHPNCSSVESLGLPLLPTRILDIEVLDSDDSIRLIETSIGQRDRYASLSHCWGKDPGPLTTQKDTLKDRLSAIRMESLPRTFQDAVKIARSLGLQYLWIDSLCIIQDSEEDWIKEACMMAKVYSNSHVSISALASHNSHAGIFRDRESGPVLEVDVVDPKTKETGHIYLRKSALPTITSSYNFLKGPVEERAWVLQERIMAPRILKYGKEQMFWECQEGILLESRSEATPTMLRKTSDRPTDIDIKAWKSHLRRTNMMGSLSDSVAAVQLSEGVARADTDETLVPSDETGSVLVTTEGKMTKETSVSPDIEIFAPNPYDTEKSDMLRSTYDLWYTIINEYSRRKLTKDSDKLPAIAALAEEFANVTGDTYLSGFWKSDLLNALLWRIDSNSYTNLYTEEAQGRKPRKHRAPSWSWASIDGYLYTARRKGHVRIRDDSLDARILDVEMFSQDPDSQEQNFAINNCSKLTISARVYKSDCTLKRTRYHSEMTFPQHPDAWVFTSIMQTQLDIEPWRMGDGLSASVFETQESHGRVMLLLLGIWGTKRETEWRGLILAEKAWGEEYQRIGVFSFYYRNKEKIDKELTIWKREDVVIV